MKLTRRQILQRALAGLAIAAAPEPRLTWKQLANLSRRRVHPNYYWKPILAGIDPAQKDGDRTYITFGRVSEGNVLYVESFEYAS